MKNHKRWYLLGTASLSFWDRVRLLFGYKLHIGFYSPSGECSAACENIWSVDKEEYPSQNLDWRWHLNKRFKDFYQL